MWWWRIPSAIGEGLPIESIRLSYAEIERIFVPHEANNESGSQIVTGYNLKTATKNKGPGMIVFTEADDSPHKIAHDYLGYNDADFATALKMPILTFSVANASWL